MLIPHWQRPAIAYNIFRWYRPGWGRYTQADPVRALRHIQPYSYASFNPLRYVDTFGLQSADAAQVCCNGQGGFAACVNVKYSEEKTHSFCNDGGEAAVSHSD